MGRHLELHVRGDPSLDLEGDAVQFAPQGAGDYERLSNLPSLNGTVLVGDLTSEDVGITAGSLGVTAESLGITPESVAEQLDITPAELGMGTAGAAKVLARIFGD